MSSMQGRSYAIFDAVSVRAATSVVWLLILVGTRPSVGVAVDSPSG